MIKVKKCCWCFSLRTGSVVIATIGIIFTITALVPHSLLVDNHEFYIKEYVKRQRADGVREISDEDIPKIEYFSKITWSLTIAYDVLYIFFSALLIIGSVLSIRILLIPWLSLAMVTILFSIIFVLAVMFALGNFASFVTLILAIPCFAFLIYIWLVFYSAYREMGSPEDKEETRVLKTDAEAGHRSVIESASVTVIANHGGEHDSQIISLSKEPARQIPRRSVVSTSSAESDTGLLKDNLQRVIGGTPPPPYEVVALFKNKADDVIKEDTKNSLSVNKSSKLTLMSSMSSSTSSSTDKYSPQPSFDESLSVCPDSRQKTSISTSSISKISLN